MHCRCWRAVRFRGEGQGCCLAVAEARSPMVGSLRGPNSGHTVTIDGHDTVLRQIPSCPDHPRATFCIAAGCAIDETVLLDELMRLSIPRDRIFVDPRAVVISDYDKENERENLGYIGSTFSGTGSAIMRRMLRQDGVRLAGDSELINKYCTVRSVATLLQNALSMGDDVIVEGTQGFGLSLLHGPHYPYVTSRDTTAASFIMEAGLSPRHVNKIVMVLRTFPIRVGGSSGPIDNETTWEQVRLYSDAPEAIPEYTSVTHRLRRVAFFDVEFIKTACRYNMPTGLAVMGLDRIDYTNYKALCYQDLTERAKGFIEMVEAETGVPVQIIGTGFETGDAIELPVRAITPQYDYA